MSEKELDTMSMAELEENLADNIGRFFYNPLGYIQYAFPWGQQGSELADETDCCGLGSRNRQIVSRGVDNHVVHVNKTQCKGGHYGEHKGSANIENLGRTR